MTTSDNGGLLVVGDLAAAAARGLERIDDRHRILIDLTEDDVLAIEPAGDNGSDEELGAVGIGSGVGHGEKSSLGVLAGEVLIGELLTVDGLATSSVAASEITTLKHELRDNAVECRARVSKASLASAEGTEVLSSLGDYIVVEGKEDGTGLLSDLAGRLARSIENWSFPGNIEECLDGHICG